MDIKNVQNHVNAIISKALNRAEKECSDIKDCIEALNECNAPETTDFIDACRRGDYVLQCVRFNSPIKEEKIVKIDISSDRFVVYTTDDDFSIEENPNLYGISMMANDFCRVCNASYQIVDAKTGKVVATQRPFLVSTKSRMQEAAKLLGKNFVRDVITKQFDSSLKSKENIGSACEKTKALADALPEFLEDSKTFVDEEKYDEWCEVVINAFMMCSINYGMDDDISDIYSAAKVMKAIETTSVEEARKLMTKRGNSDLWDMDTIYILIYNRRGAECFKDSERYNHKLATNEGGFRQEVIDVVDAYIENGSYSGRITRR